MANLKTRECFQHTLVFTIIRVTFFVHSFKWSVAWHASSPLSFFDLLDLRHDRTAPVWLLLPFFVLFSFRFSSLRLESREGRNREEPVLDTDIMRQYHEPFYIVLS